MELQITSALQTLLKLLSRLWLCAQLVAVVVALLPILMTLKGIWKIMQPPGFPVDWNSTWYVARFLIPHLIGMIWSGGYILDN
jgi:hypothetical protein